MSGKWDDPRVPKSGWYCVGITDLEEPSAICQMCEVQEIRYVHHMRHADHPPLNMGCICAGNTSGDAIGARDREHGLKLIAERRRNWLHREWRVSAAGNEYINTDGYNVVVFARSSGDGFGARIKHRAYGNVEFTDRPVSTRREAKLAAFNRMIERKKLGEVSIGDQTR